MSSLCQVQLKIGSTTKLEKLEFDSLDDCLAFFDLVSVAKVSRVLGSNINYYAPATFQIPIDDFNYRPIVRGFYRNKASRMTLGFLLHYIKHTVLSKELTQAFIQYVKIDGLKVDELFIGGFSPKL